jgi:glycosyltransferase involved in cell wall biosynthesis
MKLGVIIPVYNEARLAPRLLERLLQTPPPTFALSTDERRPQEHRVPVTRRVYLIDDASTDGTRQWAQSLANDPASASPGSAPAPLRVLLHDRNMGKGAAVRTGLAAALADDPPCDIVLIQDADLEYDPADHARLLAPILDGRADAVIGTRFGGEAHRVLYFWHYVANRAISTFSNMLTNLNLSDIECCLKAFTREVAMQITITENRFGLEPELIARLARAEVRREDHPGVRHRARVFEVAVSYAGRTYAEGKKITWRDGVSALRCIVRYNVLR